MPRHYVASLLLAGAITLIGTSAGAQVLETETARLLPARMFKVGGAYEYQTSAEGPESALPFLIEYGILRNLEFAVEPVVGTQIRPNQGPQASGLGDLEATLTFLFHQETKSVPALAVAGEVKFPTATDSLIGTGATDYAAYLVASKRFGKLDTSYNLGFTIVGQPSGTTLNNIFSFAVAAMLETGSKTKLFSEVLGNSLSVPAGTAETGITPEAAGGELVGTIGIVYAPKPQTQLYFGVSYDNNNAVLFRSGFTLKFQ